MTFTTSSSNFLQQIEYLGKNFKNKKFIQSYLFHCNFYRLKEYCLDEFNYLEDVIKVYEFDRELKLFLLNYLERIETSIKSVFSSYLTEKYSNDYIYLEDKIFKNKKYYQESINKLQNNKNIPLFKVVEFMTFGEISKWLKNLNDTDTKEIAKFYKVKSSSIFKSIFYHLTEIRNKSAHHHRIWNNVFSHKFEIPKQYKTAFSSSKYYFVNTLFIMNLLLDTILSNQNNFLEDFWRLVKKYDVSMNMMGINNKNYNFLKANI